jgi:hypothetical protein
MQKRHKDLLRSLVSALRNKLVGRVSLSEHKETRGDLDRELERLGIAPDGTIKPLEALPEARKHELFAYGVAVAQIASFPLSQRSKIRNEIIERAAYTWINRLLALRAMEVRDLIDNTLRGDEAYGGISERLFILRETQSARALGEDGGWWAIIEDVCNEQAQHLQGLFGLDDPAAALRPSAGVIAQCIIVVGGSLANFTQEESDATFADPDVIGWAYQFYQEEGKAEIDAKCKSGEKVRTRSELAAKTQLFTEPYMVQWLLQNSLGRSYHEAYPQSLLPANWAYYVQPEQLKVGTYTTLDHLTLLDPCMGSGHFLRAAFDLFVEMYKEQFPAWNASEIADRVLSKHLHGIDLDPRAAQLSALTLYLRAWELIYTEAKEKHYSGQIIYTSPTLNLATTPTNLDKGALARHLKRHPQDEVFNPLIEELFAGLEQAEILGSLLRPREHLDRAIAELQKVPTIQRDMFASSNNEELRIQIAKMAKDDPAGLKKLAIDRVAASFHEESHNVNDVTAMLFGREAEQGVRLLQLLDQQYAVVATNPPYMGSNYMSESLKRYVRNNFLSGQRDLYTSFLLRCLELCQASGRTAMVTMHTWMFLHSFRDIRAITEDKLISTQKKGNFTGILRETQIELLAHLGSNAFEEIKGEVVQIDMHIIKKFAPQVGHQLSVLRLVKLKYQQEKLENLKKDIYDKKLKFRVDQNALLQIRDFVISVYYLPHILLELLRKGENISKLGYVNWSVSTCDNNRFLRFWWEVPAYSKRWFPHVKGGGYCKWEGFDFWAVEWRDSGIAIKSSILEKHQYLKNNYEIKVRDANLNIPGWTFSSMAGQGLAVRKLYPHQISNAASPVVFLQNAEPYVGGFLNSIIYTFILRGLTTKINVDEGYVESLPIKINTYPLMNDLVNSALPLKKVIISSNIIERTHFFLRKMANLQIFESILHLIEGMINTEVANIYNLPRSDIQQIQDEIGTPAGWYPLIANYSTLPALPENFRISLLPQNLVDNISENEYINPDLRELTRIKHNLLALYEAGPGAKDVDQEKDREESNNDNEEENIIPGARIPIPTETFLEELSVKMQLHPISVYWLLEELRAEGARCKPEELHFLKDRLSVVILHLLGHRWPRQIEEGEPVPPWAERSGIIPLVSVSGKLTLSECLRERIRDEDGNLGAQKLEAQLEELTGLTLEEWLRHRFFSEHISQFKHRPVAWHLSSTPIRVTGRGKKASSILQQRPAFECILYYHASSTNTLARIRNEFVGPLIQRERNKIEQSRQQIEETSLFTGLDNDLSAQASERIRELEAFVSKLRAIEERGFACSELQTLLENEPLDRWSGNGYLPPVSREDLSLKEEAWHVDINDGVRVNIAPLQIAGVLTREVLKPADARKAIADRARWRSDERRWVRTGKLPRCGWMDEQILPSPVWEEMAPKRLAEKQKLEQKRQSIQQDQLINETGIIEESTEEVSQ